MVVRNLFLNCHFSYIDKLSSYMSKLSSYSHNWVLMRLKRFWLFFWLQISTLFNIYEFCTLKVKMLNLCARADSNNFELYSDIFSYLRFISIQYFFMIILIIFLQAQIAEKSSRNYFNYAAAATWLKISYNENEIPRVLPNFLEIYSNFIIKIVIW